MSKKVWLATRPSTVMVATAKAVPAHRKAQAKGRQRWEGKRPSGKTRNISPVTVHPRIQIQLASQANSPPAGRAPGRVSSAYTA